MSTNVKTILLIIFTTIITFIVQTYMYPDAGKNNSSKFSEYSFQTNYWSEKIYEKFDFIKYSGAYENVSLHAGQKTVNRELFDNIDEYHYQIKGLLRVLNRHSGVAVNIMQDVQPLLDKASGELGLAKIKEIHKNYKEFEKLLAVYHEKIETIEGYLPKLTDAFTYQDGSLSTDEKVELTVKQIELLMELYSSKDLFQSHGSDPFEFVRDFANVSQKVLMDYADINTAYNKKVSNEQVRKNSVLLFLIFCAAYLAFKKEGQPQI